MTDKAKIKEIFSSIQGEGPFIGYKQLFVRFCGCNLTCKYCDTDYRTVDSKEYTIEELVDISKKASECHSISLTGGEPLLSSGFLKEFLPQCPLPVYLETNATLAGELGEIIDYVDYIAADIKLASCTGGNDYFNEHDSFFAAAGNKTLFAKVVFDTKITEKEIMQCCKLCAKYNVELILQPRMDGNDLAVDNEFIEHVFDTFIRKYKKTRLIPQVHKFLNVR